VTLRTVISLAGCCAGRTIPYFTDDAGPVKHWRYP
jgi:hypothetical protein